MGRGEFDLRSGGQSQRRGVGANGRRPSRRCRRSSPHPTRSPPRRPATRRAALGSSREPAAPVPAIRSPTPAAARRPADRSPTAGRRDRIGRRARAHPVPGRQEPRVGAGADRLHLRPQRRQRPAAQNPQHVGVTPLVDRPRRWRTHRGPVSRRRPAGPARRPATRRPSPNRAATSAVVNGAWVRA